jgi:hypothetical protein
MVIVPPERIEAVFVTPPVWSPAERDTVAADKVKWDGRTLVGAYYDCVLNNYDCPSRDQFWEHYLTCNQAEAATAAGPVLEAMRWRCLRAYNSFILEHQLLGLLAETRLFRSVTKSESLDTNSAVDLLLVLGTGEQIGVQIRTGTAFGDQWGKKKARRQAIRTVNGTSTYMGEVLEFSCPFEHMIPVRARRPNNCDAKLHMYSKTNAMTLVNLVHCNGETVSLPPRVHPGKPMQYRLN